MILSLSAKVPMKFNTTLTLTVAITNTNCEDIRRTYSDYYLARLNAINYEYYNELCGGAVCEDVPEMTCDVGRPHIGTVNIPFGLRPYVYFLYTISNLHQLKKSILSKRVVDDMSRVMRKPVFCICDNKDADQLRGNREADQRLCFRYTDSTIHPLPKSEISSL